MKSGSLYLSVLAALSLALPLSAQEDKPTCTLSLGAASQYVSRGYQVGKDSLVFQPNFNVSYKGFSASLFANLDTKEHKTDYLFPANPGHANLNECDLTLSYTHSVGKVSLTGGWSYFGYNYAPQTQEVFVSATYDTFLKPTLAVYRDIDAYPATYVNLAVSHSLPVAGQATLDLGASAGCVLGDSDSYRTPDGHQYRAAHDGMLKVGMTVPLNQYATLQPSVQYWFPLSGEASQRDHNPFGKMDSSLVAGVALVISF